MSTSINPASDAPFVLIVDDDAELCELLSLRLEAKGYRVASRYTVEDAVKALGTEHVDAMLVDLRLGSGNGFDVLEAVRKRSPDVPVIILTAHGSIETAVEAMKRGAFGFITKPFLDHDLLQKLAHATESYRLRREVAGLRRLVGAPSGDGSLLGVSPGIEQVREIVARVAPTEATVLILGESGTGKELVARSIHSLSPRSKGPFVAVNCAALAPELLESTLFGHTKGAFTGATADRDGLFGAARKGTLFLDEIGEASPSVQAKLLRVLQEKRYTRVGSNAEQEADVRVVAATNRDLRQEVAEKRFREDLFYRLHVLPVVVPPLRERAEDVPLLAEMFLERTAARHGTAVPRISPRARRALSQHTWPGNVRELANVMEAALVLSGGAEIEVEHLPGISLGGNEGDGPRGAPASDLGTAIDKLLAPYRAAEAAPLPPMREARDAFERAYVEAVLARAQGNVALAAKLAGRNRTDFYDLLRRHGRSAANSKRSDSDD
ncbi:Response regulator of zinc sigma-54-dependent two-component system [Labilithrix luteola]|uniref:Response regulator of zinc sigma-54-dependent two-component system n=1 Tax=Labilithrix luteola TaxID=1391654 RepID=A0A0K1PZ84_9BACT|nr:sigma-54 dependent transcriptional regulator [Labilithrix luteola]AKU98833.1 Response regulator of zinc sigma-54-dependent two-component system [Labilithrix luteola]